MKPVLTCALALGRRRADLCRIALAGSEQHVTTRTHLGRRTLIVFAILLACPNAGFTQAASNVQTFALSDAKDLVSLNVTGRFNRVGTSYREVAHIFE
jgi:hypothetical protein